MARELGIVLIPSRDLLGFSRGLWGMVSARTGKGFNPFQGFIRVFTYFVATK